MSYEGYKKMSEADKDHVRGFRKKLLTYYNDLNNPSKAVLLKLGKEGYKKMQKDLDMIDNVVLGNPLMKDPRIPKGFIIEDFLKEDNSIKDINPFLETFTTERANFGYYKDVECIKKNEGEKKKKQENRGRRSNRIQKIQKIEL